ncbi:hypothetical protein ACQUQP_14240 [Marinobacterium sp. YM272]|uniref:hypothetical protein n=1 Tax=Marinobacterium sp. YM272 TaxID=3421654 RepID=UPI003D7FE57A
MNQPEIQADLASNLCLLCSYYKSIAKVCRRLNISRPQFKRYRGIAQLLTGLKMGVLDNSEPMLCCARVVYEYLGKVIRLRKALAKCGRYAADSKEIDSSIRDAVRNDMAPGEGLFRARH